MSQFILILNNQLFDYTYYNEISKDISNCIYIIYENHNYRITI